MKALATFVAKILLTRNNGWSVHATALLRLRLISVGPLQVETPVLERSAGGAEARPFLTFHNALGRSFALRIATGGIGGG